MDEPIRRGLVERIKEDEDGYTPMVNEPRYSSFSYEELSGYVAELLASGSYSRLDGSEKNIVMRAINKFYEGEPEWGIEGEISRDNLLGLPLIERRIDALSGDLMLCGGFTLLDIDRVDPGFWERNPEVATRRLGFANMVGAALLAGAAEDPQSRPNSFQYIKTPFITEEFTIAGDVHGDLRIAAYESYPHGSIDPTGMKVGYAPYGNPRFASAYHSSEPVLLIYLLQHMDAIGMPEDEQKKMIDESIHEFVGSPSDEEDKSAFSGFFGDYGDEGDLSFHMANMEAYFSGKTKPDVAVDSGILWSEMIVSPQGRWRLQVRTEGDTFVLQNVNKNEDGTIQGKSPPVEIPSSQIYPFVTALLRQASLGAGRTAPASLLKVLSSRLEA